MKGIIPALLPLAVSWEPSMLAPLPAGGQPGVQGPVCTQNEWYRGREALWKEAAASRARVILPCRYASAGLRRIDGGELGGLLAMHVFTTG